MMRVITDEFGYPNLVDGTLSKLQETLLRFPYSTYLCAICKGAQLESEKVLTFHQIIDAATRKGILSAADLVKADQSLISLDVKSSVFAFVFASHWFSKSSLVMYDKFKDDSVHLFFYRNAAKDPDSRQFLPPIGMSKRHLAKWPNPGSVCIGYDRVSGRTHAHVSGITQRIMEGSEQEANRLIERNIRLIDAVIKSQNRRSKGRSKGLGL